MTPSPSPSPQPTSTPTPSPSPIGIGKIKNIVAQSSKDSEVKVTWDQYSGAKKYKVYVDKYQNGEWEEEKSTSNTNATIKDLKSNQMSSFRVKAYDSKNKEIAISGIAVTRVK